MAHPTAVHPKMNAIAAIRLNMVVCAPTLSAATGNLPRPVGIVKYFSLQSNACLNLTCLCRGGPQPGLSSLRSAVPLGRHLSFPVVVDAPSLGLAGIRR